MDIKRDFPPCSPISERHLTAAIIIGICSGLAPARAEFIAIFSTVASPNPGGMSHTTWSDGRLVPDIRSATAESVGGKIGRASDQSLRV